MKVKRSVKKKPRWLKKLLAGERVLTGNFVAHILAAVFMLSLTSFLFSSAYISWEQAVKNYYKPTPLVLDFIIWAKRAATINSAIPSLITKLIGSERAAGLTDTLRRIFSRTAAPVAKPAPAPVAASAPSMAPPAASSTAEIEKNKAPTVKPVKTTTPPPSPGTGAAAVTPSPVVLPPAPPPDTVIVSGPSSPTTNQQADFVFGPDQSGISFEYSLDNGGWTATAKNLHLAGVSDGSHTILARTKNSAGAVDSSPASFNWVVNLTPPPSGGLTISVSVDSYPARYINTTTASFSFSSNVVGATFECRLDGADWQACAPGTTYTDMTAAEHNLSVRAVDPAYGQSDPQTITWLIDLVPPTAAFDRVAYFTDHLVYDQYGLTVSYVGDDDGGTTPSGVGYYDIEYNIDGGEWQGWNSSIEETTVVFGMPMTINQTAGFRVRAQDNAGNLGDWGESTSTRIVELRPNHLVISEIQISGATSTDEFVELYNPTNGAITMSSYSLTVKDASGTEVDLLQDFQNIQIDAYSYLLVAPAEYDGAVIADIGYSEANFIGSDSTILLYNYYKSQLVDKVGFGNAIDYNGSPYPSNPAANQSIERIAVGTSTPSSMAIGGAHNLLGNSFNSNNNAFDFVLKPQGDPQNVDYGQEILGYGGNVRLAWSNIVKFMQRSCLMIFSNWLNSSGIGVINKLASLV